jgi:glycosyltransferase involved in cell wall biosynthesis
MKSILIFEEFHSGHHLIYLKYISEYFYKQGYKVIILCNNQDNIVSNIVNENIIIENISFNNYNKISFWFKLNRKIIHLQNKYSIKFDVVFFNWLDTYISSKLHYIFIDLLFGFDFSGIAFQSKYFRNSNKKNSLISLKSKRLKNIFILDSGVIEPIKIYLQNERVYKFPDFADNSKPNLGCITYKDIERNKAYRKVILSIGSVAKRKGILTLLEASKQLTNSHLFVIVGKLSKETFSEQELAYINTFKNKKNILIYFKHIKDESDFNAIIESSDILYAGYEDWYHSSNMLAKAALFKKPVLVNAGYYMEEMVKENNMGEVFSKSVESLVESIKSIKGEYTFDDYLKKNNRESLKILEKVFDE